MTEVSSRKLLAQRWFDEAYNHGQTSLADQLFAPEARFNGQKEGAEGPKRRVQSYRTAFPDICANIQTILEEGDQVFIRWIAEGTHQGQFNGIPATGQKVNIIVCVLWRFEGQQVIEDWTVFDRLSILEQMGITLPRR